MARGSRRLRRIWSQAARSGWSKSALTATTYIGSNAALMKAAEKSSCGVQATARVADVTPAGFNARTRVHEYGGGDYAVSNGTIVFSNFTDQRLYRQDRGSEPKPLTPDSALRYADGQLDRRRNHFLCVREDHSTAGEAINTVVRIDLGGGDEVTIVVSGNDFYSSPRLSPDGSQLAWLTWNHPNMPWDGTELWVAQLNATGTVIEKEKIAGGVDESIFQPEWSPDGTLYFVSDRTGWWNLYRWKENNLDPLCQMEAEFGQPQWVFGTSLYDFASARQIVCCYTKDGCDFLAALNTETRALDTIDVPFATISQVRVGGDRVLFIGASSTDATSIVSMDLTTKRFEVLQQAMRFAAAAPTYCSACASRRSAAGMWSPERPRASSRPGSSTWRSSSATRSAGPRADPSRHARDTGANRSARRRSLAAAL